jgi:2-(3-amino-3-carboxypropyl)histidine synthase
MKIVHLETRSKARIKLPASLIRLLPEKTGVFTTVQYIHSLDSALSQLKRPILFKDATYDGQILGCTINRYPSAKALLYIGDGIFHPLALALKNDVPVYTFDPLSRKWALLPDEAVQRYRKRRMAALAAFHTAEYIGILVSTKSGQSRLKEAMLLKRRLKKKSYILLADEFNYSSLENFPFVQCFVNTACPRISYDDAERLNRPVINIEDLA